MIIINEFFFKAATGKMNEILEGFSAHLKFLSIVITVGKCSLFSNFYDSGL